MLNMKRDIFSFIQNGDISPFKAISRIYRKEKLRKNGILVSNKYL